MCFTNIIFGIAVYIWYACWYVGSAFIDFAHACIGTHSAIYYRDYMSVPMWLIVRVDNPDLFILVVTLSHIFRENVSYAQTDGYDLFRFVSFNLYLLFNMMEQHEVEDLQINDITYFFICIGYCLYISRIPQPATENILIRYIASTIFLILVLLPYVHLVEEFGQVRDKLIPEHYH